MATEVRGIVAREVGRPAPIERIVLEDPGPGEVLVKVLASGVCHTDLHFQLGSIGTLPILMGHEGAGIVEAVGHPKVLAQALRSRDLAGVCTLIGVPSADAVMHLPLQNFFGMGGSMRVSWYGDCLPTRDFPLLASWYLQGDLKLDELLTAIIALEEVQGAFEAMERGETLRSVIKL